MTAVRLRRRASRCGAICIGVVFILSGGCVAGGGRDLERELELARETIEKQKDDLQARDTTIAELNKRLDTVRAIRPEDLAKIFYPDKLEIDGLSGGYDTDGQPGDEGVVVYLRPIDAEGDVLKVAGEIRIQLYDLAAPPAENLLGEYVIPVEQARNLWYGKLLTYFYAVKCPWPHGPPKHPEITIRATFIDYLTQRVISAQRPCTVALPLAQSQ
jgi:hypothetical protein